MCYKIISFENKLNTNKIERATATQPQKNLYSLETNNKYINVSILYIVVHTTQKKPVYLNYLKKQTCN